MEKQLKYHRLGDEEPKSSSDSENIRLMDGEAIPPRSHRRQCFRTVWKVLGVVVFLLTYTPLVVLAVWKVKTTDPTFGGRIIKSPASDYLQHEIREVDYLDWEQSSAFFGEPSKKVDANWHELMKYHNMGLPESFMQRLDRVYQGVRFPDGKYMGSLMVYHHLHCLKHIYHALHPDYYAEVRPPPGQEDQFQKHTEHCLGALKAYIMCKADVTVETMLWSDKHTLPLHNVTSTHQCVRWDSVLDFAMANNEDVFAEGMLVHPKFGPLYKDRKPLGHIH